MQSVQIATRRSGLAATQRIDRWWLAPVTTALAWLSLTFMVVFWTWHLTLGVWDE